MDLSVIEVPHEGSTFYVVARDVPAYEGKALMGPVWTTRYVAEAFCKEVAALHECSVLEFNSGRKWEEVRRDNRITLIQRSQMRQLMLRGDRKRWSIEVDDLTLVVGIYAVSVAEPFVHVPQSASFDLKNILARHVVKA